MESTRPKPFVFVLMPFDAGFDDIYKFGIKGAAEEAGAYAERVDEQIFTEGILERVFNQINKADVIVADVTGRNPNVFYEVGYAHALGKVVLLLTQNVEDIPFDVQHRPHIVYERSIKTLRNLLTERIKWAINEAQSNEQGRAIEPFELIGNEVPVPSTVSTGESPLVLTMMIGPIETVSVVVRNLALEASDPISHLYLLAQEHCLLNFYRMVPSGGRYQIQPVKAHPSDAAERFSRLFRTSQQINSLPPETFETFVFGISAPKNLVWESEEELRLKLHTSRRSYSYRFRIAIQSN